MAIQTLHVFQIWQSLLTPLAISTELQLSGFQRIEKAYNGRGRHYHNMDHLAALLDWTRRLETELTDADTVRWAIFYHDLIYNPRRQDNEQRSAAFARREMSRFGVPETVVARAEDMILRTQTHHGEGADPDTRYMLDMDLSILGSDPEIYRAYAAAVRREYRWVPAPMYRKGRAKVLQHFLERDHIYFSDYFRDHFEMAARDNLKTELERLSR